MSTTYDTIIIGLGISGVTALSMLARRGLKVLGLEAASTVGGRVKTMSFGDGVVELGAEWIHGTVNSKVYEEAMAANVDVLTQDMDVKVFRSNGEEGDSQSINSLIDYCLEDLWNPMSATSEPLGQYVERECRVHMSKNYPDMLKDDDLTREFFSFMNLLMNNYEASNDWDDITTRSRYEELEGHQHVSWHRRGYNTLFDIVLNKHNGGPGIPGANMQFNKEVTQILYQLTPSSDVLVKCADTTEYRARSVIVTVSLGVLKDRHTTLFSPPLPKDKVEAINKMSMGVMDKVILSFDEAWWPTDKYFFAFIWRGIDKSKVSKEDIWITKIFGASRPMGSSNVLTLWTSGETAKLVERLPEDVVKARLVDLLQKFMGGKITIPHPTGMIRSLWHSNRYTLGSYSHDSMVSATYPRARETLATPLNDSSGNPRVLFAGEATNPTHFSTVHGAMESGLREVNRLLDVKCKI